ncbi:unnamed protein product [Fraxinus pennsylvanica]|uniref:Uncharacterized protein n=1 Tax=Fraxinus pennsylvanica TaxID=56036 RepID=A0AAD1Z653_9LAMI|nr:unnamed protein product [Fraxinus pennsylvanica]
MNNLGSLKQRGDREINQIQQDDGKGYFPFPIFWMPYKSEEMEHEVDYSGPKQSTKSIKLPDNGDNFKVNGEHTIGNASSRTKESPGNNKAKEINVFMKDSPDKGDKKCPDGRDKKKSHSHPKASNCLLFVCELTHCQEKNTNGSSRSPSPLSDKVKLNLSSNKVNIISSSTEIEKNVIDDNKSKNKTTNKKTIHVMEGKIEYRTDERSRGKVLYGMHQS